jgi:phosphate-selective porin OprO/OprP
VPENKSTAHEAYIAAPELVVRFSHEDLVSGVVQGGSFNKTYLGMNWWATRRWKMGFGWGHT